MGYCWEYTKEKKHDDVPEKDCPEKGQFLHHCGGCAHWDEEVPDVEEEE